MSGVKDGDFNRVTISNDLGVGRRSNFGTQGQVLKSGGQGRELTWGSNSATLPEGLVAGANITFNPAGVYNGSVETTISATDTDTGITTLIGGDGIIVEDDSATQKTIKADLKSGSGLIFTGGEIDLASIPNSALANSTISGKALGTSLSGLTFGTGITASPDQAYDGSTAITITADTDTTLNLIEGDGINIVSSGNDRTISANIDTNTLEFKTDVAGAPEPKEIAVKKLPHTLTITDSSGASIVFDGDADKTITISDSDTTYQGGDGIIIDTTTNPDTIKADLKSGSGLIFTGGEIDLASIPNSALANSTISGVALGGNLANLSAGSGISMTAPYNGSTAVTISATTDATTRTITKTIYPTNLASYSVYRRQITNSRSTSMLMYPIDTNFNYTFNHTPLSRYYEVQIQFSIINATSALGLALEPVLIRLDKDNSNTNGWGFPSQVITAHASGNKAMNTTTTIILDLGASYATNALPQVHPTMIQQAGVSVSPSEGRRATNENAIVYYGGGATSINGSMGLTMVMTPLSESDVSISEPTSGSPYTIPPASEEDY